MTIACRSLPGPGQDGLYRRSEPHGDAAKKRLHCVGKQFTLGCRAKGGTCPPHRRGATNVTSEPMRDPVTDSLITPQNSALVVIDYQPSQIQAVTSIDHDLLVRNIVSVARLAKTYGLPIPLL